MSFYNKSDVYTGIICVQFVFNFYLRYFCVPFMVK